MSTAPGAGDARPDPVSDAPEEDVSDALAALAASYGVDTVFEDWQGIQRAVDRSTIVAVLAALGVDAGDERRSRAALAAREETRWEAVLPPYVVARSGTAATVVIHVPHGTGVRVDVRTAGGGRMPAGQRRHDVTPGRVAGQLIGEALFELPRDLPTGYHQVWATVDGADPVSSLLIVAPARLPPTPGGRTWGVQTQLYSVRSRGSWGIGDLADLAELAVWTAAQHGAGFTLVNPLLAGTPTVPLENSPYLPATRRFTSPLYLRVEDIPEAAALSPGDRRKLIALHANAAAPTADGLLNRDAAWTAKRAALELLYARPRSRARRLELDRFRRRGGQGLADFAVWSALCEMHSPDWTSWPEQLRDPRSPAVAAAARQLSDRVGFHSWLQWQADAQLAAAARRASAAGMALGIVHDLPIGVHPTGADAWALQDVVATGVSVGAPADAFNQQGQDWSAPPLRPDRLAATGFAAYREQLRHVLAHAGGIRIDHVIGLFRLWWVPAGNLPSRGTYVRYDHEAMLAILMIEAERAGAAVIGEDLGNVQPWVREVLTERGVLGTSVLWFERAAGGAPKPAGRWRELALGSVTVHDLPPTAGYLAGTHIELRDRLGLLTRPVAEEAAEDVADRESWLRALEHAGLLASGDRDEQAVIAALHRYVTSTGSRLVAVALTDAVGDRTTQNQPGTSTEYPNWRLPLSGPDGSPMLLEQVSVDPRAAALFDTVAAGLRNGIGGADTSAGGADTSAGGADTSAGGADTSAGGSGAASAP